MSAGRPAAVAPAAVTAAALELARLRAGIAVPVDDPDALVTAAGALGRSPERADRRTVLAPHPDAPTPADLGVTSAGVPDLALVALGLAIGLAWQERDRGLLPGASFTVDDVTAAARRLGVPAGASAHVVGYLRHVLAQAGFVETDADTGSFRLGPAVAAWSEADLEAFRRNRDVLSAPAEEAP